METLKVGEPVMAARELSATPHGAARFTACFVFFLLWLMPCRLRRILAAGLAPRLLASRCKRKRIVETNLRYCFPDATCEERERLALAFARSWLFSMLSMGKLWFGSRRRLQRNVRIEGAEHLEHALASGRPVILLAPHTVGLEHGALCLASRYPMLGLTRTRGGDLGGWVLHRLRTRHADRVFDRETSMRSVIRELQSGRILYYLPDEDHGQRRRGIFVRYFGRKVNTVLGSGRLVALCDAVVVPCMTRLDIATGTYTVGIEKPLRGLENETPERICAIIRSEVERMIRSAPENYLWSLRMFQTLENGARNPDYAMPANGQPSRLFARFRRRRASA